MLFFKLTTGALRAEVVLCRVIQQREEDDDFSKVDYFLISDRALLGDPAEPHTLAERPVSLGISGSRIFGVWEAHVLRGGPVRDRALAADKEIIDLGARPLVPTFVNGHTHLALAPLRGITSVASRLGNVVTDVFFRVENHLTAADVHVFTKLGAYESLLSGVGEVWDHYYHGESVAAALAEVGLCGVVAPTLQDVHGPSASDWEKQFEATIRIAESERFRGAEIRAAWGPHATDTVSDELFAMIGQEARSRSVPVHLHLAQSSEEMHAPVQQKCGKTPAERVSGALEDCAVLIAHGLYLTRAECLELARRSWVLGYCPYSQLQFGILSPFSSWLEAGGAWAIGTDCVASNDALDVQRELPLIGGDAALRASFSASRADFLRGTTDSSATEDARKSELRKVQSASAEVLLGAAWGGALGRLVADRRGGIAPGAVANFQILDPNHPSFFPGTDLLRTLAYASTTGAIDWMVVRGRKIGEREGLRASVLHSPEYLSTLEEARRRRDELFERAQIAPAP